eukprot:gene18649-18519_t
MLIGLLFAAAIVATPPGGVLPEEKAAFDSMATAQALAADATFSGGACADARVEPLSVTPVKIADQPELVVWREKVRVTGCGRSAVHNLNIARVGGATWRMTYGLPGETLTGMQLQGTAFPAALAQAKADLPGDCQGMKLKDLYIAARHGGVDILPPGAPDQGDDIARPQVLLPDSAAPMVDQMDLTMAWMEVWPIELCGHDRTLAVVFIPLRDGARTVHLFMEVWRGVETDGPGALPIAAPAE